MLTTRCPDCQTTFRITSVVLHKAAGQVRCGQCQSVFSAFDSLTDTLTAPAQDFLQSTQSEPILAEQVERVLQSHADLADDPLSDTQPQTALEFDYAVDPPEQLELADQPGLPDQHERALSQDSDDREGGAAPPAAAAEHWYPAERVARESPKWRAAAALAALALALQAAHHFRAPLARAPVIGGAVSAIYDAMGNPVVNPGEPQDFSIVEWVATAQESESDAPGALEISAGIRNESSEPLPYPLLSLQLTDRWEAVIGARVFTPDEYMNRRLSNNARIRPATTITANLDLVDPGPEAYGFEVDICIAADAQRMHCKSDIVFE